MTARNDHERERAFAKLLKAHPGARGGAQCRRLLAALETMGHVTTFEGSRLLDLYDVRARKMTLVKAGHNILMTWRVVQTESGQNHKVGVYTLVRGKGK